MDVTVEIRILGATEDAVLSRVAPDVFDRWIDADAARTFLADPRTHLAVAIEQGVVVGMASAHHYHHPDKPQPQLWIDEVGVAATHRRRGVASRLLAILFDQARALGCGEAWVLAERGNDEACKLYEKAGGHTSEPVMFTFALAGPPATE
jgi:GNAT superfamily N-acetyltransferase